MPLYYEFKDDGCCLLYTSTIVICTLTGLSIVLTGAWQVDGLEGVQVTTYAFQNGLPFPQDVYKRQVHILALSVVQKNGITLTKSEPP